MAKESSTGILARTLTQKKHKDIHGINGLRIFYGEMRGREDSNRV